jgi:gamma-glutamylputrescine oxidase
MPAPDITASFLQDYPATYYRDTISVHPSPRPPLATAITTDVCIIGGGLSGLCTALSLLEQGQRVVVLEKHRVGWGASGRNGGLVLSGFDYGMPRVSKALGLDQAQKIFNLTTSALSLIKERISRYQISCGDLRSGIAVVSFKQDQTDVADSIARHNKNFGTKWEYWDQIKTRAHFNSPRYLGATFMPETFQIQPLDYVFGLAAAIERLGGIIFEATELKTITGSSGSYTLATSQNGSISAKHVVCSASGYISGQLPLAIQSATMSVNTFIGVTEPLTQEQREKSVNCNYAAYDDRHIMNYFRLLPDNRLLWGGGAAVFKDPNDLKAFMKKDLKHIFPSLADIKIEKAWAGTMGCSRHRMPQIGRLKNGIWYNMGHSGQGLCTTAMGGDLIGHAIAHGDSTINLLKPYGLSFTGGKFGKIAASAFCKYLGFLDYIETKIRL